MSFNAFAGALGHLARAFEERRHAAHDALALGVRQFRIHRQRQRGQGGPFAFGEFPLLVAQVGEAFLQMHRLRVVHLGRDLVLLQMLTHPFAIVAADHVLIEDVPRLQDLRRLDQPALQAVLDERVGVVRSTLLTGLRPAIEVLELDAQDGGVDRVESEIAADDLVVIFRMRAVPAQEADLVGQGAVLSDHGPAVAEAAEVLRREKRIAADRPHRSGPASSVFRANRLGGVLDDRQIVPPRDVENRIHLGALAEQVHRHDRLGARRDLGRDAARVDVERHRIDIDEHRLRSHADDGARGGEERVRRRDHLVPLADVERHQRDEQSVRTGGDADAVIRPAIRCDFLLHRFDVRSVDELRRFDDTQDGSVEFRFEGEILGLQVQHRDGVVFHGLLREKMPLAA